MENNKLRIIVPIEKLFQLVAVATNDESTCEQCDLYIKNVCHSGSGNGDCLADTGSDDTSYVYKAVTE